MARNGKGVRPASASSIEITFQYNGKRHRERIATDPTPDNLQRAELFRANIQQAIKDGTFSYAETFPDSKHAQTYTTTPNARTTTLTAYIDTWLSHKRQTLHASTINGYTKIINGFIKPQIGHIKLANLTRADIRHWISQQQASNKTIANRLSPLRTALNDAVYDGLLDSNPIAGWTWKNQQPPKPKTDEIDPFDRREQHAILQQLSGQGHNLIQFLLWTGCRPSEVAALTWQDIDWINQEVTISKALTQEARKPEAPKTKAGARTIKLLPPALQAITAQKQHTYLHNTAIFHNPRTDESWTGPQPMRRTLWTPALKKAGVRYRSLYQLRHTFASMMISSGEPIRWLSNHLGHKDLQVTLQVYARWLKDAEPNAGMKAVAKYGIEQKG